MQELIRTAESRQHKGFAITKNQAYGLLQDCAKHHLDLHSIRRVQSLFVFTGLGSVEVLSNHLIRLFASCGSLLEATHVFNTVSNPSVHTWSSIISAHVDLGLCEAALRLYCRTVLAGFDSNKCICLAALKACTTPSALRTHGMLIHDNIIRNSDLHHDVVIGNSLVHLYAKCGSSGLEEACCLFRDLPYRNVVSWNAMIAGYAQHGNMELALQCFEDMHRDGVKPNVVSWGAVISGHAQHDNGILALQCFQKMQEEEIKPDKVIFLSTLKACGSIGAIKQGRLIHDQIVEMELHCTAVLGTALVDMYVKCGSLQESLNVFINLPFRDVGPWNALITGYAQCGNLELALQGLENMQQDGIKPDVITWTAVIGGFIQNDDALLALDSFKKMQEGGVHPNTHTFSSVLKACGSMGAVKDGRLIHDQFLRSGIQDIIVGNALVDMYARCGSSKDSHELLKKLPYRNIVSWGAMIAGYSQCGNVKLALQCFDDMQRDGIKPNEAIFVSILTACSHAGLVDEAYKYFKLMKDNYGIIPNAHHHICLVDVLARAGHLNEAENLLSTVHFDLNGLRSLLTAGRTFGNVDLGRRCFDQVLHVNPLDSTGYMLMSDIYSDASMPKYSTTIQELRQCAGVQKKPGKSWIEADNKVHEFIVGDKSHPQSGEIYAMLRRLITQIEVKGYTPKLNLALQELLGMDKEGTFCQHVEIQATAVGTWNYQDHDYRRSLLPRDDEHEGEAVKGMGRHAFVWISYQEPSVCCPEVKCMHLLTRGGKGWLARVSILDFSHRRVCGMGYCASEHTFLMLSTYYKNQLCIRHPSRVCQIRASELFGTGRSGGCMWTCYMLSCLVAFGKLMTLGVITRTHNIEKDAYAQRGASCNHSGSVTNLDILLSYVNRLYWTLELPKDYCTTRTTAPGTWLWYLTRHWSKRMVMVMQGFCLHGNHKSLGMKKDLAWEHAYWSVHSHL